MEGMSAPDLHDPRNNRWPGYRLGLPETGRGSIPGFGVRVLAFAIDAVLVQLVLWPLGLRDEWWATPVLFAILQLLGLWTAGGGPGHLLCGLRVMRITRQAPGLWRPALRVLLQAVVLPMLVWDSDRRGLHDVFSGLVLVRAR